MSSNLHIRTTGKRRLPRYVVDCSSASKKQPRYGAKLKLVQKSVRIGSNYADAESASKVAEAAKEFMKIQPDGFYELHQDALKLQKTCLVYTKKDSKIVKRCVVAILQDFLRVKNAKLAWKMGQRATKEAQIKETSSIVEGKHDIRYFSLKQLHLSEKFLVTAYREDLCDIEELLIKINIVISELLRSASSTRKTRVSIQLLMRDVSGLRSAVYESLASIRKIPRFDETGCTALIAREK
jgi:hypothetical protein